MKRASSTMGNVEARVEADFKLTDIIKFPDCPEIRVETQRDVPEGSTRLLRLRTDQQVLYEV